MDWTNELILEYLHLYERETALWHPKDPEHKNRHAINDAWKRIEDSFSGGCSVVELKKKKNSLMAIFRTLSNKAKVRMKNGGEFYKPNWFAYDTMARFLQDLYLPRTKVEHKQDDAASVSDDSQSVASQEIQNTDPLSLMPVTFPDPTPRKRLKTEDHLYSSATSTSQILHDSVETTLDDEYSIAGKKLAFDLRNMASEQRIIADKLISDIVFYGKLNKLTVNSCIENLKLTRQDHDE